MKTLTTAILLSLVAFGCSAETSRLSSLRADYDEELGQLTLAGRSNWDGLADIWVNEGGELVNHGPLVLEDSVQTIPGFFAENYDISIRERVTEEVREVPLFSAGERLAEDVDLDEIPWSELEEFDEDDVEKAYCRRYYMPVFNNRGESCLIQHCANGRRTVVGCWLANPWR